MIDVTCAIIRNDEGLVLAVRRGPGMDNAGKWEFPGGKTKEGESHEDCIIREIDEELGIAIIITGGMEESVWDYGTKQIRLIPFVCETLAEKPHLREHDMFRWVKPGELAGLDLTQADIPIAGNYALMYAPETDQGETHYGSVRDDPEEGAAEAGEELARMIGRITSVQEITMVAHSAVSDSVLLSQLVTLSLSTEKRVGFMASWGLSKVVDINPAILVPYLPAIIRALPDVSNESVQRSFMRVITRCGIESTEVADHPALIEYCFSLLRSSLAAVAPKAYAMDILASFCGIYPDMVSEVTAAIQMAISEGSGGLKSMGRNALARMRRQ